MGVNAERLYCLEVRCARRLSAFGASRNGLAKTTARKGGKAGRRRDESEALDVRYRSDIVGE